MTVAGAGPLDTVAVAAKLAAVLVGRVVAVGGADVVAPPVGAVLLTAGKGATTVATVVMCVAPVSKVPAGGPKVPADVPVHVQLPFAIGQLPQTW